VRSESSLGRHCIQRGANLPDPAQQSRPHLTTRNCSRAREEQDEGADRNGTDRFLFVLPTENTLNKDRIFIFPYRVNGAVVTLIFYRYNN
jgi:hypothetical protein